ncbi:MAG: hypothetical protein PW788_02170 [Micavibrio sp.]|nr:hypothetical protein [Micavibrio sp.]
MTDTRSVDQGLSATFAAKAVVPKKQIADAEQFLSLIGNAKAVPTQTDVQKGKQLLSDLDDKTELYEFNAAILAGQEATNDKDLEQRVDTIAKSIRPAEVASDRLREALKTLG